MCNRPVLADDGDDADAAAAGAAENLENYCFMVASTACCKEMCLMKHFKGDVKKATAFVKDCQGAIKSLSRSERRTLLKEKIRSTIVEYGESGRTLHDWRVGNCNSRSM